MLSMDKCVMCPLSCQGASKIVTGDSRITVGGSEKSVFFLGEAPGADEDKQGVPFVGRAGKLLRRTIEEADIENYYISNVCYCRPPKNRQPTQEEIAVCGGFTIAEINAVQPSLIIACGATATEFLANLGGVYVNNYLRSTVYKDLRQMSGFVIGNPTDPQDLWYVSSVYHPAYILRQQKRWLDYAASFRSALAWRKEFDG